VFEPWKLLQKIEGKSWKLEKLDWKLESLMGDILEVWEVQVANSG